jgi:hypothetical protein
LIDRLYNTLLGSYNDVLTITIVDETKTSNEIFQNLDAICTEAVQSACVPDKHRPVSINMTSIDKARNLLQSITIYGFWTI